MPTALLAGAFGQRNPGDEALLTAFTDALPGWTTVVPAADPAAVTDRRGLVVPSTARHTLAALADSDAVVFAGGTVFKTLDAATGRHPHALLARGAALARGARLLGRPVALVGVGAGRLPDRRSRVLARALAASADMLVLRDDASAQILADAGVPGPTRVGADAVWTLLAGAPADALGSPADTHRAPAAVATAAGGAGAAEARPERGPLIVTISRHAGGTRHVPVLAAGIAELLAAREDVDGVLLEPWQVDGTDGDDLALARELQRALRVATRAEAPILPPPASVPAASRTYRAARLVLGQRFHSLIAAAAAGTPFVAIAHEAKCADLAARLGQQSLRPGCAVGDIAPTLAAALAGPPPDAAVAAELTRAAGTMLALMCSVLDGGRNGCPQDLGVLRLKPEALVHR